MLVNLSFSSGNSPATFMTSKYPFISFPLVSISRLNPKLITIHQMELSFSVRRRPFLPQIIPITKSQHCLKIPTNSLQFRSPIPFKGLNSRASSMPLKRAPLVSIVCASKGEAEIANRIEGRILVGSAFTVVLAVANRVLYKLALVPMRNYPFFLAQVTTFGYVAVYFSILYLRYRAGIVTNEMVAVPKSRFMAIGLLEALGVAAGMSAGAMLPGPAIPILSQAFLVWQLMFSVLILGRKYSWNQIFGCMLVTSGVILAVASGASEGQFLSDVKFLWPALMIASSAFQAGASILKEFVFIDAVKRLKGKRLDIFVVNSFGSGFQALFVFLLLPFLSSLKGIPFLELPAYLKAGATCFLNVGGIATGCEGAPLLPLVFITVNMAFNISLLNLVKMSSALVASLAATLAVPLSIYILSLPLPYIPHGASLNIYFVIGTTILVLGLMLYNLPQPTHRFAKDD